MNFKSNFTKPTNVSPRITLENKYRTGRANLLVVIAFTVLNVVLALMNADVYMLFSASIPYYLVVFGVLLGGFLPEEIYIEEGIPVEALYGMPFLATTLVIAVVILAVYFLCWFFSKNYKTTWLGVALVMFILDSIGLLVFSFGAGFENMILDVLFHVWVIYYLVAAINAVKKLKELPPEETPVAENAADGETAPIVESAIASETPEATVETVASEAVETETEVADATETAEAVGDNTPQEQQ